ncbi:hypothetical protein HAN_3g370 (nucleomorph) [Hemiselmis andersenii]|uniref:Uncharacterized protein n=1 Tax=Hemiselmis andersenii TaxID=464988 RepID=A9BK20_HEMAN|nr:hypothetical protein HAN_1g5 [Hemiselmis andersenii]XP_001712339.1 hypothetical protein HAN_1g179 [Hemiselmis andersenii]XP_001712506.1 hypothetical protein HAN_3g370 [Hemiselmis andersenii]ABW97853.1 hypothetical protein HAN_1g5 [Hemiselmis andersenii]ABW98014.1 hypothetical protein HAN_1g179 [Hemiselmis andersenii]ABW98181.1 hypothetical protein HAN_3g370 [Hemiselmis andersenii]
MKIFLLTQDFSVLFFFKVFFIPFNFCRFCLLLFILSSVFKGKNKQIKRDDEERNKKKAS